MDEFFYGAQPLQMYCGGCQAATTQVIVATLTRSYDLKLTAQCIVCSAECELRSTGASIPRIVPEAIA